MSRSFPGEHCLDARDQIGREEVCVTTSKLGRNEGTLHWVRKKHRPAARYASVIQPDRTTNPNGDVMALVYAALLTNSYAFITLPPTTYPNVPVTIPASTSAT